MRREVTADMLAERTRIRLEQARLPEAMAMTAAQRRAARGVIAEMDGFTTTAGEPIPASGGVLAVDAGTVATKAPLNSDVIAEPDMPATPGETYSVAATTDDPHGWVGLQWVTVDGMPIPGIEWGGGQAGRIVVSATAPPAAGALRMLLVTYSETDVDQTDTDAVRVLGELADHIAAAS